MSDEVTVLTQEVKQHNIIGDRIDLKGMVYAPTNEMGVIFLAGLLWDKLQISHIEQTTSNGFPDAVGVRMRHEYDYKGYTVYERIRIEFEYIASNFKAHKHPIDQCEVIICWINDWEDCPITVISLYDVVERENVKKAEREFEDALNKFQIDDPHDWDEFVVERLDEMSTNTKKLLEKLG